MSQQQHVVTMRVDADSVSEEIHRGCQKADATHRGQRSNDPREAEIKTYTPNNEKCSADNAHLREACEAEFLQKTVNNIWKWFMSSQSLATV